MRREEIRIAEKIPCQKRRLAGKQGQIMEVLLREYQKGDASGMIACIRDEYGETYFKSNFYQEEYIQKEAESGHITFLVAEVLSFNGKPVNSRKKEIAGMLALKEFYPQETMCEIASQIFLKKYRGYGLAMTFFCYGMDILLQRQYSAAYCLPVVFHDITQKLLYRLGLRATGFLLNVFDAERTAHSYYNGRNCKHSQGIQIRAVKKQKVGKVYVPKEQEIFCREIYRRLGVTCHIITEASDTRPVSCTTRLAYVQNQQQSSLEVRVDSIGLDLEIQLAELHKAYPLIGKQTENVFLPLDTPAAIEAYEKLTKAGYFFTGLKPLCSDREYMILHHPGKVKIFLEDYVLTEEFAKIAGHIRECMPKRQNEQKQQEKVKSSKENNQ